MYRVELHLVFLSVAEQVTIQRRCGNVSSRFALHPALL
jgi:hypothetical protein